MRSKKNIIIIGVIVLVALLIGAAWYMQKKNADEKATAALAAQNTPPAIDPKTIGKVVKDPATGKDFMSNQLIIEFNPSVSEEESLRVIADQGGVMEQRFTAAPLFLVRINDAGDGSATRAALKKFAADARVKHADLNFLTVKPVGNDAAQ
jgi:hypothetical protein